MAGDRVDDVEELVAETRQRNVFELTKTIGAGDVPRALALLANMLRNREPALRIQFMLARQMRQIWRAKELLAAGAGRTLDGKSSCTRAGCASVATS